MKKELQHLCTALRRLRKNCSGATAMIVALAMPALLGAAAFVFDIGLSFVAQRELQAATDAAALAGAQDIYAGTAIAAANSYSATSGNRNESRIGTASMVSGYPRVTCLSGIATAGIPCLGPNSANVIVVRQTVTLDLIFGPIVGINSMTISATATASARGGASHPVNIAVIIDTTASMNDGDSNCGLGNNADKIDCAKQGMLALLRQLDRQHSRVALLTFPPVRNGHQSRQTDCPSSPDPTIDPYDGTNMTYLLVAATNNFKTADGTSAPLNIDPGVAGSPLVRAASSNLNTATGDVPSCAGMESIGGVGTYYANVITAAQAHLDASGIANGQDAIIILTDGDADADSSDVPAGQSNYQCQRAVANARPAAAAGTWIFAIGYGASNSSGCGTDNNAIVPALSPPTISSPRRPCKILKYLAMKPDYTPDPTRFYSSSNCPDSQNINNIVTIFGQIGTALQNARLIPNNST